MRCDAFSVSRLLLSFVYLIMNIDTGQTTNTHTRKLNINVLIANGINFVCTIHFYKLDGSREHDGPAIQIVPTFPFLSFCSTVF